MPRSQRSRFILAFGLAGFVTLWQAQYACAQEKQPEHFQRTFAVSPGASLSVENYKGTIHIAAGEGSQVMVDVQKRFEGSDSDRKWWMENVKVDFQNGPQHVKVKVEYPNQNCTFCFQLHDYSDAVELDIRVPRKINVSVDGYKPDLRIAGVEGDIAIKSYKSPMLIEATTGGIHINTYKDTIRLRDVKIHGALHISSYKADTEVSARDLGESAEVETEKGDITVRVPGNAGLDVDYSGGRRATFHTDFNLAVASGSGEAVRGSVNGGGTKLTLRTVKGTVSLEKMSGEL